MLSWAAGAPLGLGGPPPPNWLCIFASLTARASWQAMQEGQKHKQNALFVVIDSPPSWIFNRLTAYTATPITTTCFVSLQSYLYKAGLTGAVQHRYGIPNKCGATSTETHVNHQFSPTSSRTCAITHGWHKHPHNNNVQSSSVNSIINLPNFWAITSANPKTLYNVSFVRSF